jgi:hypothetical protein
MLFGNLLRQKSPGFKDIRGDQISDPSFDLYMRLRSKQEEDDTRARHAWWSHLLQPRESLLSLMIGTASSTTAALVFMVTIIGVLGFSSGPWSVKAQVMKPAVPTHYTYHRDPELGGEVLEQDLLPVGSIYLPSSECGVLVFVSEVLAVAGLFAGWRRHRLYWLSALALGLAILSMLIVFLCHVFLSIR